MPRKRQVLSTGQFEIGQFKLCDFEQEVLIKYEDLETYKRYQYSTKFNDNQWQFFLQKCLFTSQQKKLLDGLRVDEKCLVATYFKSIYGEWIKNPQEALQVFNKDVDLESNLTLEQFRFRLQSLKRDENLFPEDEDRFKLQTKFIEQLTRRMEYNNSRTGFYGTQILLLNILNQCCQLKSFAPILSQNIERILDLFLILLDHNHPELFGIWCEILQSLISLRNDIINSDKFSECFDEVYEALKVTDNIYIVKSAFDFTTYILNYAQSMGHNMKKFQLGPDQNHRNTLIEIFAKCSKSFKAGKAQTFKQTMISIILKCDDDVQQSVDPNENVNILFELKLPRFAQRRSKQQYYFPEITHEEESQSDEEQEHVIVLEDKLKESMRQLCQQIDCHQNYDKKVNLSGQPTQQQGLSQSFLGQSLISKTLSNSQIYERMDIRRLEYYFKHDKFAVLNNIKALNENHKQTKAEKMRLVQDLKKQEDQISNLNDELDQAKKKQNLYIIQLEDQQSRIKELEEQNKILQEQLISKQKQTEAQKSPPTGQVQQGTPVNVATSEAKSSLPPTPPQTAPPPPPPPNPPPNPPLNPLPPTQIQKQPPPQKQTNFQQLNINPLSQSGVIDSLWGQQYNISVTDQARQQFKEMFEKQQAIKRVEQAKVKIQKKTLITDEKLLQKIEVFLKRCKLSIQELIRAVHGIDRNILNYERVDLLAKILPGEDVMSLWKNELDIQDFNDCDIFLSGLNQVKGFRQRVQCLLYENENQEEFDNIMQKLLSFEKAMNSIAEDQQLRIFLLTYKQFVEIAKEQQISGLPFKEIVNLSYRSSKNRDIDLIQFVTQVLIDENPEKFKFNQKDEENMLDMQQLVSLQFKELEHQAKLFYNYLPMVQMTLNQKNPDDPYDGVESFRLLHQQLVDKNQYLQQGFDRVNQVRDEVYQYLGLKANVYSISDFVNDYLKLKQKIRSVHTKKMEEEKRKMEEIKRQQRLSIKVIKKA